MAEPEPAPDFGPCVAWTRQDALCRLRARSIRVIYIPTSGEQPDAIVAATSQHLVPPVAGTIPRTVGLCPFHQRAFDRTGTISVMAHPLSRRSRA